MFFQFSTLVDVLDKASQQSTKGIYFSHHKNPAEFLSYGELKQQALAVSENWKNIGVKPQDKIILQIEDNESFAIAFWACVFGRFIAVPLAFGTTQSHKQKLASIEKTLITPWIVIEDANRDHGCTIDDDRVLLLKKRQDVLEIEPSRIDSKPDDIAFIQFSSGSTGSPKGVTLTHTNIITNNISTIEATKTTLNDTTFSWMPLTHDMGLIGFHINPMMVGCDQYLMPTASFIRDPLSWLKNASDVKATILSSPNFGYSYLLKKLNNSRKIPEWSLSNVRLIFNGAEPIDAALSEKFTADLAKFGLKSNVMFPVYGLAEATLGVTFPPAGRHLKTIFVNRDHLGIGAEVDVQPHGLQFVALGRPIHDMDVDITLNGQLCGEMVIGDIEIRGGSVTKGYFNDPDKTAATISTDGWLKTGDLGFFKDGELYVTGRSKDLIIINGQNIYPHDLEQTLANAEGISLGSVAVTSIDSPSQANPLLAVFVQYRGTLESFISIKKSAQTLLLAHHQLHADIVVPVKLIPKTTSGKIQRFQLKSRAEDGEFTHVSSDIEALEFGQASTQPLSETENELAALWNDILHCGKITKSDHFFAKGGNSLDALYLLQQVKHSFNVEISLTDVYDYLTLEEMGRAIDHARASDSSKRSIIKKANRDVYALTASQLSMFALCQRETGTAYNVSAAVELDARFDDNSIQNAAHELIKCHRVLSTKIQWHSDKPCWEYDARTDSSEFIHHIELNDQTDLLAQLETIAAAFNVNTDNLIRFYYGSYRNKSVLVIDCHHLICDGLSLPILFDEWVSAIEGKSLVSQSAEQIDALDIYENQQSVYVDGEKQNYWRSALGNLPSELVWPQQNRRLPLQDFCGGAVHKPLPSDLLSKLESFGLDQNTSIQNALLNFFQIWVAQCCNQDTFSVGIPITQRNADSISLPGMFVDSVLLTPTVDLSKSVHENLSTLSIHVKSRLQNHIAFHEVVNLSENSLSQSRNALYDIMFVYQPMPRTLSSARYKHIPFHNGGAKLDLTLFIQHSIDGHLQITLESAKSLFSYEDLSSMLNSFVEMMKEMLDAPEIALTTLFGNTQQVAPITFSPVVYDDKKTISHLLDDAAQTVPDKTALISAATSLSYRQLFQASCRVTTALKGLGVNKGDRVAVISPASINLLALLSGINRLGACYVPIDQDLPTTRKERILSTAKPTIVVYQSLHDQDCVPQWLRQQYVTVESTQLLSTASDDIHCDNQAEPDDLAYIIFTSGSTGEPKGVKITNRGLTNYLNFAKRYNQNNPIHSALFTSISFDLTVTTLFAPLTSYGTLLIPGASQLYSQLESLLLDARVNTLKITPAHLDILTTMAEIQDTSNTHLTCFIVGGEQLTTNLASRAQRAFPNAKIINEYGPTETVVGCITHTFNEHNDTHHVVPIGKAADNVDVYLLDDSMRPVNSGQMGEIWIGGDGVSPGYFEDSKNTSLSFVDSPFGARSTLYKTGDIAHQNSEGNLIYQGRDGDQVQLRGYRIEVTEIESALLKYDGVISTAVRVFEQHGAKHLYAFYVSSNELIDPNRSLSSELPDYMLPQFYIRLDTLPLTPNGKVDTQVLRQIADETSAQKQSENSNSNEELPLGDKELALLNAWKKTLNVELISSDSNFFQIGGDSIKALQIVAHLRSEGWALDTKEILLHPTIKELTNKLSKSASAPAYSQAPLEGKTTMTPAMNWFFDQQFTHPGHFHQSVLLDLSLNLSAETIEQSLKAILVQHDALRLSFSHGEAHYQHIDIANEFVLERAPKDKALSLEQLGLSLKQNISLDDHLLFKGIFLEGDTPQLLLIAHHLLVDGVSWRIILEDLASACRSVDAREHIKLMPKSASIQEYTDQRFEDRSTTNDLSTNQYWHQSTSEPLRLHQSHQRPNDMMLTERLTAKHGILDKLFSNVHDVFNTKTQDLLLAALTLSLKAHTKQKQFSIDVESHGRQTESIDLSRSVGWYTAFYPVHFTNVEQPDSVIRDAKEGTRNAPHHGLSFAVSPYRDTYPVKPACRFNYLGDLNVNNESDLFLLNLTDTGPDCSQLNATTAHFECDCWISGNELILQVKVMGQSGDKTASELLRQWENNIEQLLTHLLSANDIHFTPSDFSDSGLSQQDLDALF
ncbi:amino acid adenylation domain-containing protein [Enterovibrio norvegicus]|uniref:amino acid adenylation domain-containing protein n=1 Tax=Enterovibrio norvegicus TaxID=188144 RepID=UPI00352C6218